MSGQSTLISGLRRRLWVVALFGVGGAVVGGLPQPQAVEEQATTFRATHTMLLNDTAGLTGSAGVSPNQVALLATTGEVPERVAAELGFQGNPAVLASRVTVSFEQATGALRFTTQQDNGDDAVRLADTFAEVTNNYIVERQDILFQQRVRASRDRLEGFEAELDELTQQLFLNPADPVLLAQRDAISRQYSIAFEQDRQFSSTPTFLSFTTLERAQAVPQIDRGLSAPRGRSTRAIMGLVAGLALGTAIAVLLSRLDRKVRSREQAEEMLGMRARAEIPAVRGRDRTRGIVVLRGRHDSVSDSYRALRNVVGFVQTTIDKPDRANVTVVVSPGQGDGKTSLAANLAAAFVETGRRTVAVNTDFRRPRLSSAITGEPPAMLPFLVEDLPLLDPKLLLTNTDHAGLVTMDLSTIDASPGELVRSTIAALPTLEELADEIVIDTSPVGATAEPLDLVPFADVIVMVVRLGHTKIDSMERTLVRLRDLTSVPIVLVVTSAKAPRGKYQEYGGRTDYSRRRTAVDAAAETRRDEPVAP